MIYRLTFTLRIDGLETQSCHYCLDLAEVNRMLQTLEQEHGAWGFQIHAIERGD